MGSPQPNDDVVHLAPRPKEMPDELIDSSAKAELLLEGGGFAMIYGAGWRTSLLRTGGNRGGNPLCGY